MASTFEQWTGYAFAQHDERIELIKQFILQQIPMVMSKLDVILRHFEQAHFYACALAMTRARLFKQGVELFGCMGTREFVQRLIREE